eukprot:1146338-Pelagomonas_calceolata.AAC.2
MTWAEAESVDPRGNSNKLATCKAWFATPFACNARQTYAPLPRYLFLDLPKQARQRQRQPLPAQHQHCTPSPAGAAAPVQDVHAGAFGGANKHGQTADRESRVRAYKITQATKATRVPNRRYGGWDQSGA